MRRAGGFHRVIGNSVIDVSFDNKFIKIGLTSALPSDVTHLAVREAIIASLDELLEDVRPHFESIVPPKEAVQPEASGAPFDASMFFQHGR